jgi:hypothetical protein
MNLYDLTSSSERFISSAVGEVGEGWWISGGGVMAVVVGWMSGRRSVDQMV